MQVHWQYNTNSLLTLDSARSNKTNTSNMENTYNFAITTKEDPSVAHKHLTVEADDENVATAFANEELDTFRADLELVPEEFN